jgi:hypothetical protein
VISNDTSDPYCTVPVSGVIVMYLLICLFHTKSKLNYPLFCKYTVFDFLSLMKKSEKSNL